MKTSNTIRKFASDIIPCCFEVVVHGFKSTDLSLSCHRHTTNVQVILSNAALNYEPKPREDAMLEIGTLYASLFKEAPTLRVSGIHTGANHFVTDNEWNQDDLVLS